MKAYLIGGKLNEWRVHLGAVRFFPDTLGVRFYNAIQHYRHIGAGFYEAIL